MSILVVPIKKRRWIRGDKNNSYLRRAADNKQCCVGFMCIVGGLKLEDILGRATMDGLLSIDDLPEALSNMPTEMLEDMYMVNDARRWSGLSAEPFLTKRVLTKRENEKAEKHAVGGIKEAISDTARLRILNRIGRGHVRFEFA